MAVDGISFEVAPEESFGLLGPNGAGKSTAMRVIGAVYGASASASSASSSSGGTAVYDSGPSRLPMQPVSVNPATSGGRRV